MGSKGKVALLMSGGVDSSYSAYLLNKSGYEVLGIYLRLHDKEEKHAVCIDSCQNVSSNLGFEFVVLEARSDFKSKVYDEFVMSYERGETPNPCALCNPLIKFGLAFNEALKLGCDYIATGHYARIGSYGDTRRIREARDKTKDQSYFLYAISQEVIDRLIFPLGDMLKEDVKPMAFDAMPWFGDLDGYKESQEICFVDTDYVDVLRKHLCVEKEGNVRDVSGNIVGRHKGYMQYTVGKRRGFTVKGAKEPHFVVGLDPKNNEITVGKRDDLRTDVVRASNRSLPSTFSGGDYMVKVRYRSSSSKANVTLSGGDIVASLKEPVYGVARGQALVIYHDDVVLGGGVIV